MNGWQVFVEISGRPPVEVRPGESIIGRSRTAQVHIPDSTVSRQHARLLSSPLGEVMVEDLGSSNSTYVNGEKVEGRRKLADGDRILIGDAELRMRIVAPVAPAEATVRLSIPPLGPPPAAAPMAPMTPMAPVAPVAPVAPPAPPVTAPPPPPPLPAAPQEPAGDLEAWEKTPPAGIDLLLMMDPSPPPVVSSPAPATLSPPSAPAVGFATVPMPPSQPAPPALAAPPAPIAVSAPPPMPPRVAAPPAPAPPRPIDPPLRMEPPRAPVPVAAPAPAPAPPARPGPPARREQLASVTVIDRIPIPDASPEVMLASKMSRATPAGFWIRVTAVLIDAAPAVLLGLIAVAVSLTVNQILGMLLNLLVLPYALYVGLVMPATKGTTLGKKMLGLYIIGPQNKPGQGLGWGVALLRIVGHLVNSIILGVGYLLVAFTSQKQGLHDMIASTRVVRTR